MAGAPGKNNPGQEQRSAKYVFCVGIIPSGAFEKAIFPQFLHVVRAPPLSLNSYPCKCSGECECTWRK